MNIPEEIVDYIIQFAFYPHEYPYEKYIQFNKCIQDIPRVNKSFYKIGYIDKSRLHCIFYKHKIFNKKCLITVYYNYLDSKDLLI